MEHGSEIVPSLEQMAAMFLIGFEDLKRRHDPTALIRALPVELQPAAMMAWSISSVIKPGPIVIKGQRYELN